MEMEPKLSTLDQFIAARVASKVAALPTATVETFLEVLSSKLIQQDEKELRQETRRGGRGNIYRLGLLLEAAEKVKGDVSQYLERDDPEAMEVLKASLQKRFTSNFPPLKGMLKQIEAWTTRGKKPSLIGI
jgi:hypothetical protein